MGGSERPPSPPALESPRRSRGAPRDREAVMGGPEMAAATSWGGTSRPGRAGALFGVLRARTGLLEDGLELELAADRPVGRVERVRGRLLAVLRLVGLVGLGADAAHLLEG